MIPPWVRWVEVAQFTDATHASDLQDWFADRGIYARIRTHTSERPGVGTTVGYQVLPDRAPAVSRFAIEVRRDDLTEAQGALEASGWQVEGYEERWWLSQTLTLAGMMLTTVVVIGLIILVRVLGEG